MTPTPIPGGAVLTDPDVLWVFAGPFLVVATVALVACVVHVLARLRRRPAAGGLTPESTKPAPAAFWAA